ncbi:MAG: AI-2E family transporter [Muribaculaceae bacterium]|nr:AI-2E family transporter [Muribaculaceae bacterium]
MAFLDSKPYTFDRVVRIIFSLALVAAIVYLLDILKGVLLPFFVACLIAYMLEPVVQYNRKLVRVKGRILPIAITLFEVLLIFGLLGYFFIPSAFNELHQMGQLMGRYAESAETHIPFLPDSIHDILRNHIDFKSIASEMSGQDIQTIVQKVFSFVSSSLNLILGILAWFVVFLYVIFIMLDYERLMLSFRLMVPPKYRRISYKIGRDIKSSMNHYFRGQALIALIVAIVYAIGFSIVGLPLSIVIGLFNGVLFMVPYMVYVSIIPVTLLCLVYSVDQSIDFWTVWMECMAVYVVAQTLADIILTPKIMGKAMGMNPAIILLSLSIWGTLLGFLGMIIALPLTALLISYYEQYVINRHDGSSLKERRIAAKTIKDISEA